MSPGEEALANNHKEAMLFIGKLLGNMDFGSLQFEVKKHKGLVGQIIVNGHRSVKHENSAEAVNALAARMENLAKNHFTGSLSPAVIYQEGEITRVILNEYHEIDLQKLIKSRKQK